MTEPKYKSIITAGIIIPAFNADAQVLSELISRIHAVCRSLFSYKILLVDDGSDAPLANHFGHPDFEIIRLEKNSGKGAALKAGFHYFFNDLPAEYIFTLDADLQHLPENIPDFWNARSAQQGIVVGRRKRSLDKMPVHRILSNSITSCIISQLSGQKIHDAQCGFRMLKSSLLAQLQLSEDGFFLESELLIRAGWQKFTVTSVAIPTIYNNQKSTVKNVTDTLNFVKLILKLLKERVIEHV